MLDAYVRKVLKQTGKAQAELARELTAELGRSIDRAAVNKMSKGVREVSGDELLALSKISGLPVPQKRLPIRYPVRGYVGAGSAIEPLGDHDSVSDEVDPIPAGAEAVIVRGDSMWPRYFDGERLIYDGNYQEHPARLVGRECIVRLKNGEMYVKILRKGAGKLYTLESYNAPPMENQAIEWASPVLWRAPR